MTFYCTTNDCLRGYILKYFEESPPNYCGNCGSCNTNFETADITVDAQKILSCVARMKERYGIKILTEVLRGSKSEKVLRRGTDEAGAIWGEVFGGYCRHFLYLIISRFSSAGKIFIIFLPYQ